MILETKREPQTLRKKLLRYRLRHKYFRHWSELVPPLTDCQSIVSHYRGGFDVINLPSFDYPAPCLVLGLYYLEAGRVDLVLIRIYCY
jgi:hypothetical protein